MRVTKTTLKFDQATFSVVFAVRGLNEMCTSASHVPDHRAPGLRCSRTVFLFFSLRFFSAPCRPAGAWEARGDGVTVTSSVVAWRSLPCRSAESTTMAKSKNHTAHNQSCKAHRNGIKKPSPQRFRSLQGVDPIFLRNQRFARKHNVKPGEEKKVRAVKPVAKVAKAPVAAKAAAAAPVKAAPAKKAAAKK